MLDAQSEFSKQLKCDLALKLLRDKHSSIRAAHVIYEDFTLDYTINTVQLHENIYSYFL